jgi:hypothetical protein
MNNRLGRADDGSRTEISSFSPPIRYRGRWGQTDKTTGEPLAKRDSRHQMHRRVAHFIREEVGAHDTHIKSSQFIDETLFT